ncbi:hypothetical protein NQZ68_003210 [Dissostichus eleginoides]|nr:hypothetical protein NQZ68_003210 [Dissostichus eleginoides]
MQGERGGKKSEQMREGNTALTVDDSRDGWLISQQTHGMLEWDDERAEPETHTHRAETVNN